MDNKAIERITFLAKKFNVLSKEEFEELLKQDEPHRKLNKILDENDGIIALYTIKRHAHGEPKKDDDGNTICRVVGIHEDVFASIVQSDSTINKQYSQWMLEVFTKYIKKGDVDHAVRFACEDLSIAKEYLEIFHANKFKQSFQSESFLARYRYPIKFCSWLSPGFLRCDYERKSCTFWKIEILGGNYYRSGRDNTS